MFVVGLFMVPSAEFYFFSSDSLNCAASIVRVRYYTSQIVLNTLWNSYLNQATKNVYRYLYFQGFLSLKKSRDEKFENKKRNPFIFSVTSTLPSPLQLPPWAGPRVQTLLFALFFLVVGSGSTLLPLPLFVLVSVSLEIS